MGSILVCLAGAPASVAVETDVRVTVSAAAVTNAPRSSGQKRQNLFLVNRAEISETGILKI